MPSLNTLTYPVIGPNTLNKFCFFLLLSTAIGSIFSAWPVAIWFLLINVLTMVIYGADKMAARKGMRRIPEVTLLVFGVVGGWPGAIMGQQIFRHKTQKQPFKTWFLMSMVVSILATVALYHFAVRY
ncbi:DUF1294 domain-containing protein [Enterobacter cloacae]|uniref:DUF1294 domain-containing protein n=1 Tax=Enterobacter cloacae TaxID=550 RepID=UPI0007354F9E|nr:DUF1294 domain-containing protein [Enterobacter cloacae]KTH94875.1 cyanate transporter [Enterobacter cloacae subsp. cloacae]MCC1993117.1 DUF1294 domain-containing protein [Enterobacter cloacae]MCC2011304.1 DUF1294 domain-containing protein [Enterobacter cloacae]MCC2021098.1 DUF1294 domain-containing protein [Enterobacter cloacae]NBF83691.1 DUF1294 domain-containing protein [Enterobacter cloacae]